MANTSEELIKQMYESQLSSQKEQLTNDYNTATSQLDVQQQQNQQQDEAPGTGGKMNLTHRDRPHLPPVTAECP